MPKEQIRPSPPNTNTNLILPFLMIYIIYSKRVNDNWKDGRTCNVYYNKFVDIKMYPKVGDVSCARIIRRKKKPTCPKAILGVYMKEVRDPLGNLSEHLGPIERPRQARTYTYIYSYKHTHRSTGIRHSLQPLLTCTASQ